MKPWAIVAACIGMLTFAAGAARAPRVLAKITIDTGKVARIDTPMSVTLSGVKLPGGGVALVEVTGGGHVPVPAQLESGNPPTLHFILSSDTPAAAQRVYELTSGPATPVTNDRVQLKEDESGLDIVHNDAEVLHFQTAILPPPAGQSPLYARSGFIHPLCTPAGTVLTRIHPKDHMHHLGLWNPWTSAEFEGQHVDFWNLKDGTGTVRFVKFASKTTGPVYGGFQAMQEHVALKAQGGPKVALNEILDVRVWNVGGPRKVGGYFICDITTTQRCASASPLKLLAYRYGGLGMRGAAEWNNTNSNYLTSEGKDRKTGNGTRARWCDVFGQTSKGMAGVEFLSHPQNREFPEPMRIWGEKDNNGEVFFNFCPVQKKEWLLEPGNDYVLKYRLYIHDGQADAATCERVWQDFGNPPAVKVEGL
jgi:hypothetical protein